MKDDIMGNQSRGKIRASTCKNVYAKAFDLKKYYCFVCMLRKQKINKK